MDIENWYEFPEDFFPVKETGITRGAKTGRVRPEGFVDPDRLGFFVRHKSLVGKLYSSLIDEGRSYNNYKLFIFPKGFVLENEEYGNATFFDVFDTAGQTVEALDQNGELTDQVIKQIRDGKA